MFNIQDPTFWVLVSFVIFVLALFRKLAKVIGGALDKRSAQIKADLDNARRLLEDAQTLRSEQQRRAEAAIKEVEDIVAYGREEAERVRVAVAADIQAVIKLRETQAINRIAQVEAAAVAEVRNRVVDVAVAASRQILAEANEASSGPDPLVDKAIEQLPKQLH